MLTNLPHDLAVPDEAEIVDTKFGRALVYSDGSRAAEPGGLEAFIELAHLDGEELEDAVLKFVRRHGPLRLCREHEQHFSGPHADCTPIDSEPVWVWRSKATLPGIFLRVIREAGRGTRVQDVNDLSSLILDEAMYDGLEFLTWVERQRLRGQIGKDTADVMTAFALRSVREGKELEESLLAFAEDQIGLSTTATPEQLTNWAVRELTQFLELHRPRVRLRTDGQGLALQPAGLLGAMYLELASELTGVGSIYFCSVCGKAHSRDRRPRTGERCYCDPCREAGHPARLAMRDKRRRDAKA